MKTMTDHSMQEVQDAIVEEFSLFGEDKASMIGYIIGLGSDMVKLSEMQKIDSYLVYGCLSKVWIVPEYVDDRLFLLADSDALVTRGLMGLLVRVFSGQTRATIAQAPLFFLDKIAFDRLLSVQRRGGLSIAIEHIRGLASAVR